MMNMRRPLGIGLAFVLALLILPHRAGAQEASGAKPFKQEELDQMLAPLALYPDSLVSQILMASTYPLEVVYAKRWLETNKGLEGTAFNTALEAENWDPSVKSLVNFPQVLDMMNEKLDWTQKLGDAFLAQQQDVMNTIQSLRKKAQAAGNLETTEQQTVIVEKETQTIVIESADPKVIYVPTYNPTVVYGSWWYPSYPPYYYYPPGYVPGAALFSFGVGVACGAAWGYAWGDCDWNGGDVDIDIDRNNFVNNSSIDRNRYSNNIASGGRGSWQHDPSHRKGAPYRDSATATRYDRGTSRDTQAREEFRGRAESGRQDLARGDANQFRGSSAGDRPGTSGPGRTGAASPDRGAGSRPSASTRPSAGSGPSAGSRPTASTRPSTGAGATQRTGTTPRSSSSAFSGADRGSQTSSYSSRGQQSVSSYQSRSGSGSRGSSGLSSGGGMSRGGGGFSGGGGGRGGGGRGR